VKVHYTRTRGLRHTYTIVVERRQFEIWLGDKMIRRELVLGMLRPGREQIAANLERAKGFIEHLWGQMPEE